MKVQIFENQTMKTLQDSINQWIEQNRNFIDIKFVTQSQSRSSVVISVWYKETGIKEG